MATQSLTGIILAGGKSTRFRSPKFLAKIGNKSLLEIAISKLEPLCEEIIVVGKEDLKNSLSSSELRGHPFEKGVSPRSVIEKEKVFHPLIGIKEGLRASHNDANVVLACDMPFVSSKLILGLVNSKAEVCLYRYQGRIEPLLGFYRKSCLGKINSHFFHQPPTTNHQSQQNPRIIDALVKCNIDYIDIKDKWLDFFNINTKEDLIEAQKIAQRNQKLLGN